jgi:hypothetical protein
MHTPGTADFGHGLRESQGSLKYYSWLADKFRPYLREPIVEHGSGNGALSDALLRVGANRLVLTEPDPVLAAELENKYRAEAKVRVCPGTLDDFLVGAGSGAAGAIVSSNVLEHIPDDGACLRTMRELLVDQGFLCLYVPARQELYGPFDRAVGHQRRYSLTELRGKLEAARFSILSIHYRNLVGALGWFVNQRLLKQTDIGDGTVGIYDKLVFPVASFIEDRVAPPYGLNLLAIAQKRHGPMRVS